MGDSSELSGKVEKVEGKIDSLQKEVTTLIGHLSSVPKQALQGASVMQQPNEEAPATATMVAGAPSVVLRCKEWEDFQTLAESTNTLIQLQRRRKSLHADALKGNQIITYSGALPKFSAILKTWLSKQLDVPERSILEGVLAAS
jgi:hypothetical protein